MLIFSYLLRFGLLSTRAWFFRATSWYSTLSVLLCNKTVSARKSTQMLFEIPPLRYGMTAALIALVRRKTRRRRVLTSRFAFAAAALLNLIGCGYTKKEAQESFKIVFNEYISYTAENNTLIADLENCGS